METHLDPFCPVLTNLFFFSIYMCSYVYICICLCVTYCVVLCRTVSYCVVPCRTVSYSVVLCRTVSYCVVLCRTVSYYVVLCRMVSVLYDTLYDTVRRVVHPRRVGPRRLVRHCTTRRTLPTRRAPTPCTTPRRVVQCISDSTHVMPAARTSAHLQIRFLYSKTVGRVVALRRKTVRDREELAAQVLCVLPLSVFGAHEVRRVVWRECSAGTEHPPRAPPHQDTAPLRSILLAMTHVSRVGINRLHTPIAGMSPISACCCGVWVRAGVRPSTGPFRGQTAMMTRTIWKRRGLNWTRRS